MTKIISNMQLKSEINLTSLQIIFSLNCKTLQLVRTICKIYIVITYKERILILLMNLKPIIMVNLLE